VKYLKDLPHKITAIYSEDESERGTKRGSSTPAADSKYYPYDVISMFVDIIPAEWGLGKSEYPEKWFFKMAADSVIIWAEKVDFHHEKFPVSICAPDSDGYSATPISRLEVLYGLQHTLDWLFNAHIANVRKAINDTLVVDPFLLNMNDLKNPRAGGILRLRRPAWGRGVKDALYQLAVTDVTRTHIADMPLVQRAMDKVGATDDWLMGTMRQGGPERLTSKEFQGTQQGTLTRLERVAKLIGVQFMQDLGMMFALNTQQFMEEDTFLKVTGRWQQVLMKEYGASRNLFRNDNSDEFSRIKISPYDLVVDFDVLVRDGSVPGGNYSQVWTKMFELLVQTPELTQTFDITRIFKHIARNNGVKNPDDFVRVRTVEDERVDKQAQAGNLVPINEYLGAGGAS
jgi:hypothetical protein